MNPNFRWLVAQASRLGRRVIDRCNLTILMANGFMGLPEFLGEHWVEVVTSLPYYQEQLEADYFHATNEWLVAGGCTMLQTNRRSIPVSLG